MQVDIRRATAADTALVLRLITELARYERLEHEVVADEQAIATTLFGERPAAEVLILRVEDEPAGFALYYPNYSTFLGRPGLYVEDIFIRQKHRGRGYGKALMSELARRAIDRGCSRLEWSVLNWNESAIGFFRGLSALPMDQWTTYRLKGESLENLARGAE